MEPEDPKDESKGDESKGDELKGELKGDKESKKPKAKSKKKSLKPSSKATEEETHEANETNENEATAETANEAEIFNSAVPGENHLTVPMKETSKPETSKKQEVSKKQEIEEIFPEDLMKVKIAFKEAETKYRAKGGLSRSKTTLNEEDTEELADMSLSDYESAAKLLIKGDTDRFRILSSFEWDALQKAFCLLFQCGVKMTLRRLSEFLIFLLPEARNRSEEDVEQGEHLTQMHGKVQQTAVVLVESLHDLDQEMLWFSEEGLTILMQMQLGDARLFFARPKLQSIMCDLWRGARPDSYSRSFWKTVYVWTRVLCFAVPNFLVLPFWAVFPMLEEKTQAMNIEAADDARKAEEEKWEKIRTDQSQTHSKAGTGEEDDEFQCRVGNRMCWNKATYDFAVREQCRRKLFQVQSRVPLLQPCNKKYLAIVTNLLFVGYLIQETPDSAAVISVLLLSAGAWLGEVGQLFAFTGTSGSYSLSFWFMDRVNVMELVAFTCIAWTSVLCLIEPDLTELAQQFKALGVLFLGISQSMALLRMSSVFGPLISMTMSMIIDLIQWSMLLFPIVACLVAALMTLFKARSGVEQTNCLPFEFDYVQGVLRFFEIQIGEEAPLECLRKGSPHPWFGQIIMNLGLWMILILMLNMLIAMMAKTFDRIYEGAMVDFQYHFIGNLLQVVSEPAVPPVLRTLSLPYMICKAVYSFVSYLGGFQHDDVPDFVKMGPTEKSDGEVVLRRSAFQDFLKARRSSIRTASTEEQAAKFKRADFLLLNDLVSKFVEEHASDTQVQDELWRKQIARQLFCMDAKMNHLTKELEKLNQKNEGKSEHRVTGQ